MESQKNLKGIVTLVFKAVALGMGVCAIVINALGTASLATIVTLLSIGLAALAIASLSE